LGLQPAPTANMNIKIKKYFMVFFIKITVLFQKNEIEQHSIEIYNFIILKKLLFFCIKEKVLCFSSFRISFKNYFSLQLKLKINETDSLRPFGYEHTFCFNAGTNPQYGYHIL
jgi:hypothetical protein